MGFSSHRIFACNLDDAAAKAVLSLLTRDALQESVEVTPLGVFVNYVKDCGSVAEVKARCAKLTSLSLGERQ